MFQAGWGAVAIDPEARPRAGSTPLGGRGRRHPVDAQRGGCAGGRAVARRQRCARSARAAGDPGDAPRPPAPPPADAPGLAVVRGVSEHHGRAATAAAPRPSAVAGDTPGGGGRHYPSEPLEKSRCIKNLPPKACVLGCTTAKIVPHWGPPAGGHGAGLWAREPRALRSKANDQSGWHAAGILERLVRPSLAKGVFLRRVWRAGVLSHRGRPRGLASPVARGMRAPRPDALAMGGAAAGIPGAGVGPPTAVTVRVAGLAARGLGAGALAPGAARVGRTEGRAVLTRTRGAWPSPWPASPQGNALHPAAWREAHGAAAAGRSRSTKPEDAETDQFWGKKMPRPHRPCQPHRLMTVSGHR
jgi:hypothetical protein